MGDISQGVNFFAQIKMESLEVPSTSLPSFECDPGSDLLYNMHLIANTRHQGL